MKKQLNQKIRFINFKKTKSNFLNLFNKECFLFLFVLNIKKISYYASIGLYQVLLLVFICLSLLRGDEPTYYLSNPITITFLIFLLTVIAHILL
ncbi:hypothetical protein D8X55_02040 [Malacoplasma penetrans]|nr:hypothetical protein D8X55_02040 [Malacoplasma penetrans]